MTYGVLLDDVRNMIDAALARLDLSCDYSVEPARPGFGDVSSNVAFLLAKDARMHPSQLASRIADVCKTAGMIAGVESHPSGYINVQADWDVLAGKILRSCMAIGYGGDFAALDSVIEHTSVNPNKALHIGHIRNIVIGDTISRILRKAGDRVTVLNYIDDLGRQVADAVLGFTRLGFGMDPPAGKRFDAYCGDVVYVEANRRIGEDPQLQDGSNQILSDMEHPDTESARVAADITRRVLADQLTTCWRLNVSYDILNYESHILRSGLWDKVFEKLKKSGMARLETGGGNAGCWVIQDKVIVRSNGTPTYMAKDIPYAAWKMGMVKDPFTYDLYCTQPDGITLYESMLKGGRQMDIGVPDRVITVIDSRQKTLQDTISHIMSEFGGGLYIHLGYEAVALSGKTARMLGMDTQDTYQMSGRRGIYVAADTLYDKLRERAIQETARRNEGMGAEDTHRISDMVAVGAIRYEMIKQDLGRAITFDMDRSMRLEGDTAPYLQYSHARARRILDKAHLKPDFTGRMAVLTHAKERDLLRLLGSYGLAMHDAYHNLSPKVVAHYCHDLAVAFNTFYESHKVVGAGNAENARLCLTEAFCQVMRDALNVLGIDAPDRM